MQFFVHPWYMIAGGALVSLPIIIHLINRMRFKRIRWAAMEFLLKSQKRNRRRLIIEQLILLALRCLLVLLAGFLVARFIGATGDTSAGTTHIVVIDDTPSLADHWSERGPTLTSLDIAKEQVKQIARSAVQAPSAQHMRVFMLSDLDTSIYNQRLSDRSMDELGSAMASRKTTAMHISPLAALERAKALFNDVAQGQKVFHFVSDYRESDWVTGPKVEDINQALNGLTETGVNVHLLDVAHPYRSATRQAAQHHDNWAIIDFHCETHVAVKDVDTEFSLTIQNFGGSDKPRFLKVFVNGSEDFRATRQVPAIAPGEARTEKFILNLSKSKIAPPPVPADRREDRERKRRADQEYVHLQAVIDAEETGLGIDNVRDLVVEVRRKVPTLIVDGSGPEGRQPGGDYFHVETAFESSQLYEIERCTVDELDKIPLDLYPSMLFLNVPEVNNEKTLQRLQDYVKGGGSIAFILGDKSRADFYNDVLFKKYAGLFPMQINKVPYNAIDPKGTLSEEEAAAIRLERLQNDPQPKILFRDPTHPLIATLVPYSSAFRYLAIDKYFQAKPRSEWEGATALAGKAEEPVLLPNNESMDTYKARAQELAKQAIAAVKDLAGKEKEFDGFVEPVKEHCAAIVQALQQPFKFNLVRAIDVLLKDPGVQNNPLRPNMAALWVHPALLALRGDWETFRDRVLYGDPLVVSRKYGKGRVVAMLTSAGTKYTTPKGTESWNNWGAGSFASFSYEVFMMDMQKYLTGQGDDLNRTVGDTLKLEFDPTKYEAKVKRQFKPQPDPDSDEKDRRAPQTEDQGIQPLPTKNGMLLFDFHDATRPGMYIFEFFPTGKEVIAGQTEQRAYTFNVDAPRESDLRRASRDKLERPKSGRDSRTGTVVLRAPGDSFDAYKNRQPDASESPWLYLLFLLILIAEQAMAVHLSFHLKGSEAAPAAGAPPAPAAAA
jgi:hypothetical protein